MAKTCQDYGQRVQNSVFECLVDPAQKVVLIERLVSIIDETQDSLRIYQDDLLSRVNQALKDRALYPLTIVLASLCHLAQSPPSRSICGADIVCDKDIHRLRS